MAYSTIYHVLPPPRNNTRPVLPFVPRVLGGILLVMDVFFFFLKKSDGHGAVRISQRVSVFSGKFIMIVWGKGSVWKKIDNKLMLMM